MITNQALTHQSQPGTGQELTKRRATRMIEFLEQFIGHLSLRKGLTHASWIAVALVVLLASSSPVMAAGKPAPNDPILLLLRGIYQPVVNAPNLGLPGGNLHDGTSVS